MKYFSILIFSFLAFIFSIQLVFAADPIFNNIQTNLDRTGVAASYEAAETNRDSLEGRIGLIIQYALGIVGAVSVMFIIYGGWQWIVSGGNSDKAESGRKTVTNAAIGLMVVGVAYLIIALALSFIS